MSTFPGRRFPAPLLPRAGVEFTGGPSVHELLGSWWQADAGCLGTDPDAWFQPAEGQDAGDAGVDPCAASRLSGSRPRRPAICGVAAGADDRDARGEILGLRWSDLDLDVGRVAVRRPRIVVDDQVQVSEPKTAKGSHGCARWICSASAASAPAGQNSTPTGERRAGQARRAAVRRLIAAHPEGYRALLEAERRRQHGEVASGGGPDAA